MPRFDVIQLPGRPAAWDDKIRHFATKTLFHEVAWLDFMLTTQARCKIDYFEIWQDGSVVGYFCALRVKKFIFEVYHSPWLGTAVYQGPVVNEDVERAELVSALVRACKLSGVVSIELANDWLDATCMEKLGFNVTPNTTYTCPLPQDANAAWAAMKGTCRTRIRKAEKEGLVVEMTDDPAIADYFYRYFCLARASKGRLPHFDVERPRALMAFLMPADRLFAVWVKHHGKVIGAAFYPHDEHAMYTWTGRRIPVACISVPTNCDTGPR